MFINKNSIVINNVNMGQYLVEAEYQYNKLWGSDSGRNLAGEQSGTLLGIFPKLVLTFKKLSKSELEVIAPILDSATQSVTYYDPVKRANTTMDTYTGDWKVTNTSIVDEDRLNEGFNVSFIAIRKRV